MLAPDQSSDAGVSVLVNAIINLSACTEGQLTHFLCVLIVEL